MKGRTLFLLLVLTGLLTMLAGCAGPQIQGISAEDNPEHHYLAGMTALENGNLNAAQDKFDRAVYLDNRFARGYAGLAIVSAERVKNQQDAAFRSLETQKLVENLKKAAKYSDKPEDTFDYSVARIRVFTAIKGKGWLAETEDAFNVATELKVDERALTYYQGTEALAYFQGYAYLEGREFQKARDSFAAVLNAKREGKWHEKADLAWKKTDKIVRATAGITIGDVGKTIAAKDAVSRGDLAALLVDELKIEKLFAGRIPVASELAKMKAEFTPADILNHPFRDEIMGVLKWRVRGLQPKFDETTRSMLFKPADSVSRGEMAFILEDVLIKLTGDEKLAVAYFGQEKSPFPDVRSTSPYYNAVLNVTTRGIMEGELSGEFRINEPVDGADALLAIRVLNQKTNIY